MHGAYGGGSKKQPCFDGSHVNGPYTPLVFKAEKIEEAYLCQCKRTKDNRIASDS